MNVTPEKPITHNEFQQIAQAFTRFIELREATIKTPTADAELKGLSEYLANTFLNHAGEFLGCWHAVRNEYEPALSLVARFIERIDHIRVQQAAQQQAQQAAPAPSEQPSNIVPVKS